MSSSALHIDASSGASFVSDRSTVVAQRIEFLDVMRGFAVMVMVIGHSVDSVLSAEARTTDFFGVYNFIRGFTAPLFLFVAGFSFFVATEKRWNEYQSFTRPVRKRLGKMLLLLVIGYALHFPFFSLNKILYETSPEGYLRLFQVDVLHCFAVSFLILQFLVFVSPTVKGFLKLLLGLTIGIVLATPLVWNVDFTLLFSPLIGPYFNQNQLSMFPLFPYAAFMFGGVFGGHWYLKARRTGSEVRYFQRLALAGLFAIAAGIVADLHPLRLYPPHDFWKTSPNFYLIRLGVVLGITASFYFARRLPKQVRSQLVVLGGSSLMVYVLHLILVYGSAANRGLGQMLGQTLPFEIAFATGLGVLVLMTVTVYAWRFVSKEYSSSLRVTQYAFVSLLLFLFMTNPY